MEVNLSRLRNNGDATIGVLLVDWDYFCDTIEDGPREIKIPGKTRIPKGVYELKLRKELSPLTMKYRGIFDWFDWHIEVTNVPGFNYIYIHVGNWEKDTDGCILVGKEMGWMVGKSKETYKKLYEIIRPVIETERVILTIVDED